MNQFKLTDEQAIAVYEMCKAGGKTNIAIASEFGVSDTYVSQICLGQKFQHLGLAPLKRKRLSSLNRGKPPRQRLLEWSTLNLVTGCWEWHGCLSTHGYGGINVDGVRRTAHMVSYETFIGPIKEGMFVCHKCDNRICCNPDHLFLGTHQDNINDMLQKDRSMRGTRHRSAKLCEADVLEIVRLLSEGKSFGQIGKMFGVSRGAVQSIKSGANWYHLTGIRSEPRGRLKK